MAIGVERGSRHGAVVLQKVTSGIDELVTQCRLPSVLPGEAVHLCDVAVNGVGLGQRLPVHFQA